VPDVYMFSWKDISVRKFSLTVKLGDDLCYVRRNWFRKSTAVMNYCTLSTKYHLMGITHRQILIQVVKGAGDQ